MATHEKSYKRYLVEFMTFRDDVAYESDYAFTNQQLSEIQPEELVEWMSMKAFGVRNPGPDDNPTLGRSSSLEQYKKAISFFMPNKLTPWNVMARFGNPTRSIVVNQLLRRVRKQECCKQGRASQARRDMAPSEYEQVIDIAKADINQPNWYLYSAFFRFQVHLIARVDDVSKVYVMDIRPHPQFNFALVTKLCWSKNVMDERDCPDQIVLGAKERWYCVLIGLAVHLETWIASSSGVQCPFVFGMRGSEDTQATKDNVATYLTDHVLNNPHFVRMTQGPLGTHSLQKFATTHARRSGCS